MAPTNLCRLTFCCNFSCLYMRGAFFAIGMFFTCSQKMPRLRDAFSIKNGAPHRTYAFQTKANQRKQKLWRKKIKASVTQFQCGVKKGDFSFFQFWRWYPNNFPLYLARWAPCQTFCNPRWDPMSHWADQQQCKGDMFVRKEILVWWCFEKSFWGLFMFIFVQFVKK